MAIPDTVQTLTAAFTFGTLFQTAAPAILLFTKGYGKVIFKDGRRLVLVLFLVFAALWSQIEFLTLMMPTTMPGVCSAAVIVSSTLDQLARVMMEQFLLWSVGHGSKMTTERLILQGVLLLRIVAGGILVGFTRSDFAPTCVARTSILPVGIVVLALDAVIFSVLIARALSLGMFSDMKDKNSSNRQKNRALVFSVIGFGLWTATSIPMILGLSTFILILRTVLPANGLLILASIVAAFSIVLLVAKEQDGTTPEARSPFMNPMPATRELFRDNISNTGSPIVGHGYTKSGSLFVVNPSTPNESPTAMFQGSSRSGDTKGFTKLSEEITVESMGNGAPNRPERPDKIQTRNIPGYRGSSGVFPSLISQGVEQAALAPQIRPNITVDTQMVAAPALAATSQAKRSLFGRSKQPPKSNIRSLGISQPVSLNIENSGSQPFVKIPTIDLATAAKNERERREEAAARSRMIASRPAPQPPVGSSQNALRESISTKRKEMPYYQSNPLPNIAGSTAGSSVDVANGSTTSASLSPGREEVRRRSPRNGNGFNQIMNGKGISQPTLQRKQTIGLPSNPRSQRMTMAKEAGMGAAQTVMLINEIVYDNPGVVKTIINDAPAMYAKRPQTADKSSFSSDFSLKSSNSIIHRPRPYKKTDASKDRQLFPSEPSPGIKRSKSSSSLASKKSILRSQPGSPTRLPPLPPPPTSAAKLVKLLPNNTKSMTFDEKIELLFPAPPGPITMHYRRSSVPSIPRVPSVFMAESPTVSPTEDGQRSRRASKRTTLASFGFDSHDITASSPKQDPNRSQDRQTYRFSANTYRTIADDITESTVSSLGLLAVPARQSVLNDLRKSHLTATTTSDEGSVDDGMTDWASIHSKVPAIDLSKAMRTAQPTLIQRSKPTTAVAKADDLPPLPALPQDMAAAEAIVPIMLDIEEPRHSFLLDSSANKETFFFDDGQATAEDQATKAEPNWHRRIGDELPTFSERMKPRSRKMPPPTPLLLSRNGRRATVVVRGAEPSPPIDSPERAIKEIQEQLKRFEDPNRVSVGSLLQRLPNANNDVEQDNDRLRLLDNLEMEIGQQENHWQQMQTNLDRDSMSLATPQQEVQRETVSRDSSFRSSRTPSRVLERRSRIRSGMTTRSRGDESRSGPSTDSSDTSRASVWQQRLANAQMEYTANAPDLLRKRSLNFLSIHKAPAGLDSPTPPESLDSETEIESEADNEITNDVNKPQQTPKKIASLWQAPIASPKAAVGRLWNHPFEKSVSETSPEPPAKNVRPAQRRIEQALQIFSVSLWSKPRTPEYSRPVVGLWGSKFVRPRSIVTRPVTQRPARRSRRVTFLPDIVESPVPLPNKRETLGIFQFPWGEKSDQPVYQPPFNPALLAGPVLNSQLDARSRQLEPESDYSSSFFDDYEEEEDDDEELVDPESDDDFDETTLWEIASLLNSKDVPSKHSLLPRANAIIEEYESDDSEAEESLTQTERAKPLEMRLPIRPLEMKDSPRSSLQVPSTRMWTAPARVVEAAHEGLFSKPAGTSVIRTTIATPAALQMVKAPRKLTGDLPILTSDALWTPRGASKQDRVWIMTESSTRTATHARISTMMWSPTKKVVEAATNGLFDASVPRASYRATSATPAAVNMVCKPRKSQLPLDVLVSTKLWSGSQKLNIERDWISESSIRPQSPSVYSPSSSRASSPVSDSSSVKSTSTKASSVWGITAIPSWWDNKRANDPASSSPSEDAKPISKIPVRQQPKPLAPVRESRVLASRDMWEAKAPAMEKTPMKKFRRATISKQPAKPTRQAMRQQYRPNGTFQADWDEALSEAIAASRIKPTIQRVFSKSKIAQPTFLKTAAAKKTPKVARPVASEADWASALTEAISRSQPRLQRPHCTPAMWEAALASAVVMSVIPQARPAYDPSVMHPVFFTDCLISNVSDIHPAAIGHFSKSYDPATLHPVFFTESLVSETTNMHPAAMGHFTIKKTVCPGMWRADAVVSTPLSSQLWSKGSVAPRRNDSTVTVSVAVVRRHLPVKNQHLPALESTGFWKASPAILTERNWLHATKSATVKPVDAYTWTPPAIANIELKNAMWAAKSIISTSRPDIFAKIERVHVRASQPRSEGLPQLTSSSLFTKAAASNSNTHWLHQSSMASLPVEIKKSMTWTAPRPSEPRSQVGMWAPATQHASASLDLFAHLKHDNVRATPSRSVSSALPVLLSSNLFTVSTTPDITTHWLHHTSKSAGSKPAKSLTWTAPKLPKTVSEGGMWTAKAKQSSSSSPDLFAHIQNNHIRATPSRSAALPVLISSELFEVTSTRESNTHWLHQTSKVTKSMTWSAPVEVQSPEPRVGMWAPATKCSPSAPDVFAHIQNDHVRASSPRSTALLKISSTSLFTVTKSRSESTHWLHKTSVVATTTMQPRKRSTTWTRPAPIQPVQNVGTSMWISQPIVPRSLPSPMLFNNTHTEPWTRPKRSDSAVGGIESTDLWHAPQDMPESPKNWLTSEST